MGPQRIQTSMQHEIDIRPTTVEADDGSNKSKTSVSELQSCKISYSLKHWAKDWFAKGKKPDFMIRNWHKPTLNNPKN